MRMHGDRARAFYSWLYYHQVAILARCQPHAVYFFSFVAVLFFSIFAQYEVHAQGVSGVNEYIKYPFETSATLVLRQPILVCCLHCMVRGFLSLGVRGVSDIHLFGNSSSFAGGGVRAAFVRDYGR